jgi:hypothetical protein
VHVPSQETERSFLSHRQHRQRYHTVRTDNRYHTVRTDKDITPSGCDIFCLFWQCDIFVCSDDVISVVCADGGQKISHRQNRLKIQSEKHSNRRKIEFLNAHLYKNDRSVSWLGTCTSGRDYMPRKTYSFIFYFLVYVDIKRGMQEFSHILWVIFNKNQIM